MKFARTIKETDLRAKPDSICDMLDARAEEYGDKLYINFIDDQTTLTYRQAAARSAHIAHGLVELGLPKGAKVGLLLSGSINHVLAWYATLRASMVDVPINVEFRGEVLDHALTKMDVSALFADLEGIETLKSARPEARTGITLIVLPDADFEALGKNAPEGVGRILPLSEVESIGRASKKVLPPAQPGELASIRFSSGTTGLPKGVMMDHAHMLANARMVCQLMRISDKDTHYSCFPFHHTFATIMGVLATLCAGASFVVARKFKASRYWADIREHNVTRAHVLDPLVPLLMMQPPSPLDREHKIGAMFTAAGHYPEFEERFGVTIIPIYDMSELTCVAHYPEGDKRRPGSCGKLSGLFDVMIVDDDKREAPDGTDGEILVRPRYPGVMFLGYYNDAEKTMEQWRNLWFQTGDRGRKGEDGYFYFLGRHGDRIRRKGVNVSAEQIEKIALTNPALLECAAIAVPSDTADDDIKLCARLAPGAEATAREVADELLKTLPKALTVRYFELFEELPKTPTEKIKRAALRAMGYRGLTTTTWDHEAATLWTAKD